MEKPTYILNIHVAEAAYLVEHATQLQQCGYKLTIKLKNDTNVQLIRQFYINLVDKPLTVIRQEPIQSLSADSGTYEKGE